MGFRHAFVLSGASFLLGVMFISFNVDRRILWNSATPNEQDYADAFKFYTTFFEAPLAIKGLLHGFMGIGLLGLLAKLHKWDESAMFFDGSSLALFLGGIIVYISVTIPTLRTVATPYVEDTEQDRRDAVAVLAAGNTIIVGCLVGVLFMQAGQEYARRVEEKGLRKIVEEEAAEALKASEVKKDQ